MNQKSAENTDIFYCEKCNFKCSKKSNYDRHILTAKHKNGSFLNVFEQKRSKKSQYICEHCQKTYRARNGLWYHQQKCHSNNENVDKEVYKDEFILTLIKQNTDLIKEQTEIKNMVLEMSKNNVNNINNINNINNVNTIHNTNSVNNAFNLQFFLNETCKNAMNISEFIDSIKLQLTDLVRVGEIGYVEGITNIIVNHLNSLDITERPIHCTDKKREVFYIKDENKWEKENDEKKKLRIVIRKVASKNQRLIPQFREKYPGCNLADSKYSDQYNKMVIEAMGGSGDNDHEKEEKIIRNLKNILTINKDKI